MCTTLGMASREVTRRYDRALTPAGVTVTDVLDPDERDRRHRLLWLSLSGAARPRTAEPLWVEAQLLLAADLGRRWKRELRAIVGANA